MRQITFRTVLGIGLAWCTVTAGCGAALPPDELLPGAPQDDAGEVVPNQLVVITKAGADESRIEEVIHGASATIVEELHEINALLIAFDPARRQQVRQAVGASRMVEGVFDNHWIEVQVRPQDPMFGIQWHHGVIGSSEAWTVTTGSAEIIIAVLDTGVEPDHPDLVGKLLPGGNSFDGVGWHDLNGHGTSVAGVAAAASDNHVGVASIAWQNPILPIRVTNDFGQSTSWALAAGISLAVNEGARVINISFAPLHNNQVVLRQARQARLAGRLVVISAGNGGEYLEAEDLALSSAALFVGAVDRWDRRAAFSTWGDFLDLTAPGVSIQTTRRWGDYGTASGTSFAAPMVAGAAALIWSVQPDLRPSTVEHILRSTARDLGEPGHDPEFGAGRLDLAAALHYARDIVEQQDDTPPNVVIGWPAAGATLPGPITAEIFADDDIDVAEVALFVDGEPLAVATSPPYLFYLDPADHPAGERLLRAVATDTSGNAAEDVIPFFISGTTDSAAPEVNLRNPREGAVIHGVVTVTADATDDLGLASAEVLVDGWVIATLSLSGKETIIAYNWNRFATGTPPGPRTVSVRVYDVAGNVTTRTVNVTVAE